MGTLKEIDNRYYKECNVVMLPTKHNILSIGQIYIPNTYPSTALCISTNNVSETVHKPQHLKITSDDEIKEGDYHIVLDLIKTNPNNCIAITDKKALDIINDKTNGIEAKKIIATTDKSLTLFNDINDKTLYLPQPSHKFIKAFCEQGGIDKVLVEYKVPYDDTDITEKEFDLIYNIYQNNKSFQDNYPQFYDWLTKSKKGLKYRENIAKLKTDSHNTITIKPVKDKIYKQSRVIELLYKAINDTNTSNCLKGKAVSANNWIKENL